jgi:hypothetical protein
VFARSFVNHAYFSAALRLSGVVLVASWTQRNRAQGRDVDGKLIVQDAAKTK